MTERMSNEEYRLLKQQEKEDVFEMLSDATQSLLSADKLTQYFNDGIIDGVYWDSKAISAEEFAGIINTIG